MQRGAAVFDSEDTIVAVATAAGAAARGIVRLSGPRAIPSAQSLLSKNAPPFPKTNYRFFDAEINLERLCLPSRMYIMRGPASYTREDIVEIHTFASPAIQQALLTTLTRSGVRPAEPGEFTRRAFLHGRLDLAQAEAVEALIHARNDAEYRAAAATLTGQLSGAIQAIREPLIDLAAAVEASLDFSEDDIEIISRRELADRLAPVRDEVQALIGSRSAGRLASSAVRAVFFGPPNAGKSSVFNAILRIHRAIVSPHPGTTRDTIEATTTLGDLELLLVDTAGIRPSDDDVETIAISRSQASLRQADVRLCVLDASQSPNKETRDVLMTLKPQRAMILLNKSDLGPPHGSLMDTLPEGVETFSVCATDGSGLEDVLAHVKERVEGGAVDRTPSEMMVNARQALLLERTLEALERACAAGDGPPHMDLAATDLREALECLAELTGASNTAEDDRVIEDVLDRIFATFCIGK